MIKETSPWAGLESASTDDPPPSIRRPINIQRTALNEPHEVNAGDTITVTFRQESDLLIWESHTPPIAVERDMTINCVLKFEVIDEFGVDVGIGIILGGVKR